MLVERGTESVIAPRQNRKIQYGYNTKESVDNLGANLRTSSIDNRYNLCKSIVWLLVLAEREGFEPPIGLHLCRISSAVHSTTLPPLRKLKC